MNKLIETVENILSFLRIIDKSITDNKNKQWLIELSKKQ